MCGVDDEGVDAHAVAVGGAVAVLVLAAIPALGGLFAWIPWGALYHGLFRDGIDLEVYRAGGRLVRPGPPVYGLPVRDTIWFVPLLVILLHHVLDHGERRLRPAATAVGAALMVLVRGLRPAVAGLAAERPEHGCRVTLLRTVDEGGAAR